MQIFMINLANRTDRLALMDKQMSALKLSYRRVDAVNGLGDADIGYPPNHAMLSKPEFACYLSHVKLWRLFIESGESHCLVLEDDLILADSLPEILRHKPFFNHSGALTRLENAKKNSLVNKFAKHRFKFRRLLQVFEFEAGTGAMVLTRGFAQYLLAHHSTPEWPIDHIMNNPKLTNFHGHKVFALDPAPAIQRVRLPQDHPEFDGNSDLRPARIPMPIPPEKTRFQKLAHMFFVQPFRNIRHNLFRTRKYILFSKD